MSIKQTKKQDKKDNLDENKQQPKQSRKGKKKIIFGEDGEQQEVPVDSIENPITPNIESGDGGGPKGKKHHQKKPMSVQGDDGADTIERRWYEHFDGYNTVGELVELKDAEIAELRKLCRVAFEAENRTLMKNNPSDAKWLLTALEKGTSRDRANAGALLVQTNPLCNLQVRDKPIPF